MDKCTMQIKNLSKNFGGYLAVNNFNGEINEGECVGLIGSNGAGKTTLLRMISDVLLPTDGEILINGKSISKQKKLIGYLPQYPSYYDWMTAEDVLEFYATLSGMHKSEIKKATNEILEKVGLKDVGKKRVSNFSGGMKQRLGIAQAIIHKPKFVIMDEPVSALDPIGRREVLDLIKEIKKETSILFSTHILNDAQEVCDRFYVLKKGVKIKNLSFEDIANNKSNYITVELIEKTNSWLQYLKESKEVIEVKEDNMKVRIKVKDVEKIQNMILDSIIKFKVKIAKIDIINNSLEDYFLELVGEESE